jgi:hypothetical protein
MSEGSPSFAIPAHPERTYPRSGGVEYEGDVVFELRPADAHGDDELDALVTTVLSDGPYRMADFLELPMALYLVRDEETTDVFRVSIRDGSVRLHVLPATESQGLRAFYDRLVAESDTTWSVDRRTDVD